MRMFGVGVVCLLCIGSMVSLGESQNLSRITGGGGTPTVSGGTPPTITTSTLSAGTENVVYSQSLGVTGGTGPFTWTQIGGQIPAGLSLSTGGVVSGTPTVGTSVGAHSFTVRATDSLSASVTGTVGLTINYGTPVIQNNATIGPCLINSACSITITSVAGESPITYTVTVGALPTGLSLTGATGVVSGTPTLAETQAFTVRARDAQNTDGTKALSLTINAAATGACDGAAMDDFRTCLAALNGSTVDSQVLSVRTVPFRGATGTLDIDTYGTSNSYSGWSYDYAGDTHPNKQDAAKIRIEAHDVSVQRQISVPESYSSGDVLFIWDAYITPSWRIGAFCLLVCDDAVVTQKAWQIRASKFKASGGSIWTEVRDNYIGSDGVANNEGSSSTIVSGWDPSLPKVISGITRSGTTATATSTSHGFSNGDQITIFGAENEIQYAGVTSAATGTTTGLITTAAPHGLTQGIEFPMRFQGEAPNVNGSSPADLYWGTATSTTVIQTRYNSGKVNPKSFTQATTGGTVTMWPYYAYRATISGVTANTFDYTLPIDPGASATKAIKNGVTQDLYAYKSDTQVTGTDCATIDIRGYNTLGLNSTSLTGGGHLLYQAANAIRDCNVWGRYYLLVEINQGDAYSCGTGTPYASNYDKLSLWYVAAGGTPVQIYANAQVDTQDLAYVDESEPDPTKQVKEMAQNLCATEADPYVIQAGRTVEMNFEHNSSGGGASGGGPIERVQYVRNYIRVHSPASNAIVAGSSSITIGGTEILLAPVP